MVSWEKFRHEDKLINSENSLSDPTVKKELRLFLESYFPEDVEMQETSGKGKKNSLHFMVFLLPRVSDCCFLEYLASPFASKLS